MENLWEHSHCNLVSRYFHMKQEVLLWLGTFPVPRHNHHCKEIPLKIVPPLVAGTQSTLSPQKDTLKIVLSKKRILEISGLVYLRSFNSSTRDISLLKAKAFIPVPFLKVLVVANSPGVWSVHIVAHQAHASAVAQKAAVLLIKIVP